MRDGLFALRLAKAKRKIPAWRGKQKFDNEELGALDEFGGGVFITDVTYTSGEYCSIFSGEGNWLEKIYLRWFFGECELDYKNRLAEISAAAFFWWWASVCSWQGRKMQPDANLLKSVWIFVILGVAGGFWGGLAVRQVWMTKIPPGEGRMRITRLEDY